MQYTIQSQSRKTRMSFVPRLGALGTSLIVNVKGKERELLYFPKGWTMETHPKMCGGFPFIFPICGRLSRKDGEARYLYDGQTYEMPIHGFAHRLPWELIECKDDRITMRLRESEFSLKEYPFAFEIILEYEVRENEVICRHSYKNTGDKVLPYYGGFHPYFLMPAAKDKIELNYKPKHQMVYNSNLTDILGTKTPFKTPCLVSTPELNESLAELGDNKNVSLRFPDGSGFVMRVSAEDDPNFCPFVQLYHIPDAPFLCIEPWMGHPNAMNTVGAVRCLAPQAMDEGVLHFQFFD